MKKQIQTGLSRSVINLCSSLASYPVPINPLVQKSHRGWHVTTTPRSRALDYRPLAMALSLLPSSTSSIPRRTIRRPLLSSASSGNPWGTAIAGGSREIVNAAGVMKWRARVSFFTSLLNKKTGKSSEELKEELLEAISQLDRGADATPEDQDRVDKIARQLEAVNKIKEPLRSDLLNGKWELLYTTSTSILQNQRPKILRPNGKIYQAINADTLRAQNMETWPYFNQVTANLVVLNEKRVAVKFDTFKILGLIPIKAPERARGELEITYLDEEIRVSRGDKGNLFILKMVDPSYRVPL